MDPVVTVAPKSEDLIITVIPAFEDPLVTLEGDLGDGQYLGEGPWRVISTLENDQYQWQ